MSKTRFLLEFEQLWIFFPITMKLNSFHMLYNVSTQHFYYSYLYFLEIYVESKENNSKDEDINNNKAFIPL